LGATQTACYAWALLPNHFQLLLPTGNTPIAGVMRQLLSGCAGGTDSSLVTIFYTEAFLASFCETIAFKDTPALAASIASARCSRRSIRTLN